MVQSEGSEKFLRCKGGARGRLSETSQNPIGMLAFNAAPVNAPQDPAPNQEAWVDKENPFHYREFVQQWISPTPKRHVLGVVGGNEVSLINGNQQDLESDLRGTTRPLTRCNEQEHIPIGPKDNTLTIQNRKTNLTLDLTPINLPSYQMWAYAGAPKPLPMNQETCGRPNKY